MLSAVNEPLLEQIERQQVEVEIVPVKLVAGTSELEGELDEMWSFVQKKENQRWLWHAIDHGTGKILAYVLGTRTDNVFVKLKTLLEPFGISKFYTDGWGAYERKLDPNQHQVGKANTQKIERKHRTLRTRIKRLVRRTICFSRV
jgi:insertion element IS1 protein InsB